MKNRKLNLFNWFIVLFYFLIIFFLILGDRGWFAYSRLDARSKKLAQQIKEKERSEKTLKKKLEALRAQDSYYEYEIKNKILYLEENESIIFFPKEQK